MMDDASITYENLGDDGGLAERPDGAVDDTEDDDDERDLEQ